jgi:hypothetical protein
MLLVNIRASKLQRGHDMKIQVTITRTDTGANTQVKSDTEDAHKDVASWDDALAEAQDLGLINAAESIGAKVLPPGFPFHTSADVDIESLMQHGFVRGKGSPPR